MPRGRRLALDPHRVFFAAGSASVTAIAGADPIDILLDQIVALSTREASHWRSRLLAGVWHRIYVLARGRGDDELAQVARAEVQYHRGRRAAAAEGDIGSAIAAGISRARLVYIYGEHDKGSMGGSG